MTTEVPEDPARGPVTDLASCIRLEASPAPEDHQDEDKDERATQPDDEAADAAELQATARRRATYPVILS